MASSALLLGREFQNLKKRPKSNYFQVYDLHEDNIHNWIVFIIGPPNTAYEGGIYKSLLRFPNTYPMEPPSLQFLCQMYHPNIYRDGKVCITTLQTAKLDDDDAAERDSSAYWRPVLGVEQALLSVVSLLSDPNTDDPANLDAAERYVHGKDEYMMKCKDLAEKSKSLVPEDFVRPVVASAVSSSILETPFTETVTTSNKRKSSHLRNDCGEEEEDDESQYIYSDSEYEYDNDNNGHGEDNNKDENL